VTRQAGEFSECIESADCDTFSEAYSGALSLLNHEASEALCQLLILEHETSSVD
jgi:hypothetical protein